MKVTENITENTILKVGKLFGDNIIEDRVGVGDVLGLHRVDRT